MKFGACIPNTGATATGDSLKSIASNAERLGYESLWASDHILVPGQTAPMYERVFESITALTYLSTVTTKVKLGISSLILAMREPLLAVRQLATLDVLSGGRAIVAVAAGWGEGEFSYVGANFHNRGRRLDESINLFRALWGGNHNFQSKYLPEHFENAIFEPAPVQKELKIWVGGASKGAMRRAAKLGDAWHPNAYSLDVFKQMISEFRSIPGAESKEINVRIPINLRADKPEYKTPSGERRLLLTSNMAENIRIVRELEELGVSALLVAPNPDGKLSTSEQVDALQLLADEFIKK